MRRLVLLIILALYSSLLPCQNREVTFRYAPASWFTAICFPDDWQKSVITSNGSLGDDFGPGPYARPLTEISFGVNGFALQADTVRLESPRVPIGNVVLRDQSITVHQSIFSVLPSGSQTPSRLFMDGRLERSEGLTGCPAWANPPVGTDPAFRGVAWGVNRPVKYRVRVSPGSHHIVVLGLCEPYKLRQGLRTLVLSVEGAGDAIADPVRDDKINIPSVRSFAADDVDHDGWLDIEARASLESPDPNVILNAVWMFQTGTQINEDSLIRGQLTARAELYWPCGMELDLQSAISRQDVLLGSFPPDTVVPTLIVRSRRQLEFNAATGTVSTLGRPYIRCTPAPTGSRRSGDSLVLEFPRGVTDVAAMVLHGSAPFIEDLSLEALNAARDSARVYWMERSGIPFGHIVLPDSNLQALLDASIRNLYALAENIDGRPQFQPGPSVYRGLWIHDAVWHNSAALMLGDVDRVKLNIESLLHHQMHDGQIEVMSPYPMNRETPAVLYLMSTFARMTNNRAWLEQHWNAVQRGNRWLWALRQSTLKDPQPMVRGLFPAGFSDGGLGGVQPEYASVYWSLIGYSSTAAAARWLGFNEDAATWERYFNELLSSFKNAVARDRRTDGSGNIYLPMKVGDTSATTPPQRANWGILDAQGLAHIFGTEDSLVHGTLQMLRAETREGLPPNTGWLSDGLWPFFGTLEAIAHLYQHEEDAAGDLLYAIADHASPTWTWVEEQLPHTVGTRTTGDASNATASALFIKLIRRMTVLERDSTLDLIAGVPPDLYQPGAHMEVHELPTLFGKCTFHLDVARDNSRVTMIVNPLQGGVREGYGNIDLRNLKRAGFVIRQKKPAPDSLRFNASKGVRLVLTRS